MAKKSGKNGWYIRERTDPRSGQVRPCRILFRNGDEIEHHWLDPNQTGQTEFGAVMDATKSSQIVLKRDELNKKYHARYKSQTDYPGVDTKIEKNSLDYKQKMEEYRNSDSYRRRYSSIKIKSVQCRAETADGVRCQNQTTDPSGLCYLHSTQKISEIAVRCQGTNRDGSRCLNSTTDKSGYCSQHQKQVKMLSTDEQIATLLDGYERHLNEIYALEDIQKDSVFNKENNIKLDRERNIAEKQRKTLQQMLPKTQYDELMAIKGWENIHQISKLREKYYKDAIPPHQKEKFVKKHVSGKDLKDYDLVFDEKHEAVWQVLYVSPSGNVVSARRIFTTDDSTDSPSITFRNKKEFEIVNPEIIEPISLASKGEFLNERTRAIINGAK